MQSQRNVDSINNTTEANADVAGEVASSATLLRDKADKLQHVVNQFKIHRG